MQLLQHEPPAVLYNAGLFCSDSMQPLSDSSSVVTTDLVTKQTEGVFVALSQAPCSMI